VATERRLLAIGFALIATLGGAADAFAAPIWRLEQPPPPPGAPFSVPLGPPGDLQFFAPNRGLLAVEGNATVPRGLFVYNGVTWRQLSTVCGGAGDTTRVAWAGPTEFWTITQPSQPRVGSGTSLCHFLDGQVVGSYSTPPESQDPFRQMYAAACNGPSDCWFGGVGSQDPTGDRVGAFHLHWDGSSLTTSYNPKGRGVSDLEVHAGGVYESVVAGQRPESRDPADVSPPESGGPFLLHRIGAGGIVDDPFVPATQPDESELLGLDSDGAQLWAVGGGAASGQTAPEGGGAAARPPLAARAAGVGAFAEVPLDATKFAPGDRFADVAAVPGTDTAWVAVQPFAERRSTNVKAKVALLGADGTTTMQSLPLSGSGRGSAARIACTSATDCWLATYAGWLFHYTDGTPLAPDPEPAFGGTIAFRPNEAAEQFVPDARPVDDSQLFAPPPLEVQQQAGPQQGKVRRLAPLIRKIRSKLRGRTLAVSFVLTRKARVALIARRRGKVVARTKQKLLPRGRRSLALKLDPKRWPTRLSFRTREPGQRGGGGGGGGSDDTVVTTGARP
jgi:hypothetical protein